MYENEEVVELDDATGLPTPSLGCHSLCGPCAGTMVYQEGHFYYFERLGWHVQLDYIHSCATRCDVIDVSDDVIRSIPLKHLSAARFPPELEMTYLDCQLMMDALTSAGGVQCAWSRFSPCCFAMYNVCGWCLGLQCTTCLNQRHNI